MKYYIYHIFSVKIGCSTEPEKRVREQGYSDYEILEEYDCIHEASRREIELQKEYGYRVDVEPYYIVRDKRRLGGIIGGKIRGTQVKGANNPRHGIKLDNQLKDKISKANIEAAKIKLECPYCGKKSDRSNYGRWHGDNCKKKGDS